jgi:hypothetical protein
MIKLKRNNFKKDPKQKKKIAMKRMRIKFDIKTK